MKSKSRRNPSTEKTLCNSELKTLRDWVDLADPELFHLPNGSSPLQAVQRQWSLPIVCLNYSVKSFITFQFTIYHHTLQRLYYKIYFNECNTIMLHICIDKDKQFLCLHLTFLKVEFEEYLSFHPILNTLHTSSASSSAVETSRCLSYTQMRFIHISSFSLQLSLNHSVPNKSDVDRIHCMHFSHDCSMYD